VYEVDILRQYPGTLIERKGSLQFTSFIYYSYQKHYLLFYQASYLSIGKPTVLSRLITYKIRFILLTSLYYIPPSTNARWTRTLDVGMMGRVFYHCATTVDLLIETLPVPPFPLHLFLWKRRKCSSWKTDPGKVITTDYFFNSSMGPVS